LAASRVDTFRPESDCHGEPEKSPKNEMPKTFSKARQYLPAALPIRHRKHVKLAARAYHVRRNMDP
jgi:hypothetical protein